MSHYQTYNLHKAYSTPEVTDKHLRKLDAEVWIPGGYQPDMSILEIGCGTGLILAYLDRKGVATFAGIDQDKHLLEVIPDSVRSHFEAIDVQTFLSNHQTKSDRYDRIIMFDVIEHFDADEGCQVVQALRDLLTPNGRIHLKVPNAGSPWGQQFQYGDLTHKTAYTPESLRQQAVAAGMICHKVYGQKLGSPARQCWERLVHGVLNKIMTSPPEIWEGNIYALLERKKTS